VRAGFSTHAHHDHLLWHPSLGEVPRWAAPRTAELAVQERAGLLEMLGDDYPDEVLALFGHVTPLAGETVPGTELVAIVHDGHAPGHAALFDPASRVLVAGDMLSDVELPLPFWPDDLPAYLAGLDALAPWVAEAAALVPGHGHPSYAPMERLDADRRYLDDVLSGRVPDDPRLGNPGMSEMYERLVSLTRTAPP
jgi:glyoxylase-like metal-dependent hydrolase (beta-lactamase superfamily II)